MIFTRPNDDLKQLNAIRAITYIREALGCIEIGKTYDRTDQDGLIIKLETKINKFLSYIKDRKGISGFKLLNINIKVEKILFDLRINFESFDDFYMTIEIPYTSTNYGLK